ncbi:MAG: hypothetical protein GKR89_13560 [Candidatus Latescibacteria bacterium]|nr:hypothetical protein [Candidatus Latescibacterota bacterium]
MKKLITCLAAAGLLLGASGPAESRGPSVYSAAKTAQSNLGERALVNINNIAMWFKRDGFSGRNPLNDNSGVTYPRSTDQIIFQDGLIWGGIVKDGDPQELRVGGQTYEIGTVPGRIVSKGVAEDAGDESVRIYRVRRDYQTADLRLDASEMLGLGLSEVTDADIELLRNQYARDWREWPVGKGAPYYDNNGDGQYDPDVDEPGVAGADQVVWFVVNDLDLGATQSLYGSKPIGLEVQMLFWGYARTDALGDVIFKKYTAIYKGTSATPDTARIENMYFAQWSDPDLGDFGDDYAGADINLSLGYVYNSIDEDSHYVPFGLAPPAAGYDFLQGPIVPVFQKDGDGNTLLDDNGSPVLDTSTEAIFDFGLRPGYRNLPMTSFVYFAAGSAIDDPELGEYIGTQEWYNLLRGFQPQPDIENPVPYANPLTGNDTFFTLDGDPTTAQGWNDGVPLPPGDRRIVLNTGPFEMALGDTQEVVVALLGGISTDRLRSVSKLKFSDQFVQDAYNSFFEVPSPPVGPDVRASDLDQTVLLDWGWNSAIIDQTEDDDGSGFVFEGYNLYQLPSAESTLDQGVRLGTFDIENGVTTILGIDLDDKSGVILNVPLQVGSDFGVKRTVRLTQDAIRSGPLVNGQEYYFAVTAYNRNTAEGAAVTTLESTPRTLICVPQTAPLGTRYESEAGEAITSNHDAGVSDGSVGITVVDPTRTSGDSYKVEFIDQDGATAWQLRNTTRNEVVIGAQTDQSGTGLYVPSEGFEIQVSGPPPGMKDWDIPSGERWFTWAGGASDWGAEGFQGAMTGDPNHQWFAPTTLTPDKLRTVELRFTDVNEEDGENRFKPLDNSNENTSYAYRYIRGAGADPPALEDMTSTENPWDFSKYIVNTEGPGTYVYQDRVPIALSAWDMESDPPRRLEVAFLENNQPGGLLNGTYGPPSHTVASNIAGSGPREWLFIFDLEYTDPNQGQNSEILLRNGLIPDTTSGEEDLPFMWILFAAQRGDAVPNDGDSFLLLANHVNTPADAFDFTVPGSSFSKDLEKEDAKLINVFPNPYYGVNEAETSSFNHFVTFSHLPQKATIRLYDLAGNLVQTLEKDDGDQFVRWDLSNHNQLPVASGIYLAHIELPDVGKNRVLKVVVLQEQQFLENY